MASNWSFKSIGILTILLKSVAQLMLNAVLFITLEDSKLLDVLPCTISILF